MVRGLFYALCISIAVRHSEEASGGAGLTVFIPKGNRIYCLVSCSGNIKVFLSYRGFTPFVIQLAKVKKGGQDG